MSITQRIFFGAAASWFSRGVTIVLGLVLLPVLFRHLPKEELGIWLLLGQSWATLGILDFGFGVTLTRRIAFAKGKSSSDPNGPLTGETQAEIADLLATGLRIYRVLALVAFVVSFGLGFFYLRSLSLESLSLPTVWSAWALLCLSFALTIWAAPWTALLQGVGYVGWDAILASFISAVILVVQIIAVLLGGGLVALALVAVIGALSQRLVFLAFARRKRPELFRLKGKWCGDTFRSMTGVALRSWGTALGIMIANQTDHLFIARFEGSAEVPAYRAAQILAVNLNMLAAVIAGASSVFVSHLWQIGGLDGIHRILSRNLRLGLGIVASGAGTILALGQELFDVWLGPGNFIGTPVLLTFFAWQYLEVQAHITSSAARATEDEFYLYSSLLAGALKIGLAFWLVSSLGLIGIAFSSFLSQALTNYWFMVWRGLTRLKYTFTRFFSELFANVIPVGLVSFLAVFSLNQILSHSLPALRVILCLGLAGAILALYLYLRVLSKEERIALRFRCLGAFRTDPSV